MILTRQVQDALLRAVAESTKAINDPFGGDGKRAVTRRWC